MLAGLDEGTMCVWILRRSLSAGNWKYLRILLSKEENPREINGPILTSYLCNLPILGNDGHF